MQPIGLLMGGADFTNYFVTIKGVAQPTLAAAKAAGSVTINYGVLNRELLSTGLNRSSDKIPVGEELAHKLSARTSSKERAVLISDIAELPKPVCAGSLSMPVPSQF